MKLSIILPVYSETNALIETVKGIKQALSSGYLYEIVIIVASESSDESRRICRELAEHDHLVNLYFQRNNPGVGWAFREALEKVTGTHVVMMSSDGETDPKALPAMIRVAEETGCDIVVGNRWSSRGGFESYNPLKLILNYIFQKFMRLLFKAAIDDYTYAYRLYKREVLAGQVWRETKHPFLLESLLRPLKKGAYVRQVSIRWVARKEGKSKNTFFSNFMYLKTAIKIYFERKKMT